MNQYALRQTLKSGPLRSVYQWARTAKRKLRGETLIGHVPYNITRFSPEDFRAMIAEDPVHARLYYSLGLTYLESEQDEDIPKALAAFRSAETLSFESRLRTALYQGKALLLLGQTNEARCRVMSILPEALTDEENRLRARILSGELSPANSPALSPVWQDVAARLACPEIGGGASLPESAMDAAGLLICGDPTAASALLCPNARYLLAAPEVTGLTPEQAVKLNLKFAAAVGPDKFEPLVKDGCRRFLAL